MGPTEHVRVGTIIYYYNIILNNPVIVHKLLQHLSALVLKIVYIIYIYILAII